MNAIAHSGTREVIAHNDAEDSGNPMHDDEVAKRLNFKGALVPGVTVFGYMTHALLSTFGEGWLDAGGASVRLRQPVYADEPVSIRHRPEVIADGTSLLHVEAVNADGEVCALGAGAAGEHPAAAPDLPSGPIAAHRTLPAPRWPAVRETFAREKVLGSLNARFEAGDNEAFLDAMHDDHPVYRNGACHPAWLLRQANLVVDQNFDLGPWIHVSSALANHRRVRVGETIEVRAQVVDLFDRKGNDYADLDVALLIEGDPARVAMRILHRAIYRMGAAV